MRSKVVSKLNAFDPLTKRQQSAALQMGKCWPRRGWTGGKTDHQTRPTMAKQFSIGFVFRSLAIRIFELITPRIVVIHKSSRWDGWGQMSQSPCHQKAYSPSYSWIQLESVHTAHANFSRNSFERILHSDCGNVVGVVVDGDKRQTNLTANTAGKFLQICCIFFRKLKKNIRPQSANNLNIF